MKTKANDFRPLTYAIALACLSCNGSENASSGAQDIIPVSVDTVASESVVAGRVTPSPTAASPVPSQAPSSPSGPTTTPSPTPSHAPATNPNTVVLGGGSLCGQTGVEVCDGFETAGPPDVALWQVQTQSSSESVVNDGVRAARGAGALHIHTPNSGYERAVVINSSIFPAPNNTFYGRAFVYYAGTMPQAHFTLFSAYGPDPISSATTYVRYGGQFALYIANYFGDDAYQHAGVQVNGVWQDETAVPANRWVCMEWQYKGDTNEMHFWQDGQIVPRLSVVGHDNNAPETWTAPAYNRIALGWEIYSDADSTIQSYDLWIDEVALDYQRIGCSQ